MKKSFWFLVVLAILVVVFAVQNAEVVPIKFIIWKGELSLAILLILTFLFGLIMGVVYYYLSDRKSKNNSKKDISGDVAFNERDDENDELKNQY